MRATLEKAAKITVMLLIGVPGTLLTLPLVIGGIVLIPFGLISVIKSPNMLFSELLLILLLVFIGVGGAGSLSGFWSWPLTNLENASEKRLKFISFSCFLGAAISSIPLFMFKNDYTISYDRFAQFFMLYGKLGVITGVAISASAFFRLTTRSRGDGLQPRP